MSTVSNECSEIQNININQNNPSQNEKITGEKIIENNKEISTIEETNENPPLPKLMISNVVSTIDLGTNLDLGYIASKLINCECIYTKSGIISAVKLSLKHPKATAMIYKTGKINCFGAKSELASKKANHFIIKSLKKLGYAVEIRFYRLVNIVGTCYLNFQINLTKLSYKLNYINTLNQIYPITKDKYSYNCDIFPGLIYYMNKPEITVMVFSKGRVNFVGARNKWDLNEALKKIYPILLNYKKNDIKKDEEKDESIINFNNINYSEK